MPGFWRYALPEEMQWTKLPAEHLATCDDCFWVAVGECHVECRCCTYFPQLPNFAVGLALKDPRCRARMLPLVQAGYVLPQGLLETPSLLLSAARAHADKLFGKVPELVCPFLDRSNQQCQIYPYRNSVCATFFCENDHGKAGEKSWEILQLFVGQLETILGQWAMEQVGLDSAAYIRRLDGLAGEVGSLAADGGWFEKVRRHLWAEWFGREVEFLERCADQLMAHRQQLFTIACNLPLREPLAYERALRQWIPEPARSEVPAVSDVAPTPLSALWYRVQLEYRRLWQLPFDEGPVRLADGVVITVNSGDDRRAVVCTGPWMVRSGEQRIFVPESERRALNLFESPQTVGEALLQTPEFKALDDPRAFLSWCLRRKILVEQ